MSEITFRKKLKKLLVTAALEGLQIGVALPLGVLGFTALLGLYHSGIEPFITALATVSWLSYLGSCLVLSVAISGVFFILGLKNLFS